jgi:hypothetical protein
MVMTPTRKHDGERSTEMSTRYSVGFGLFLASIDKIMKSAMAVQRVACIYIGKVKQHIHTYINTHMSLEHRDRTRW